MGRMNGNPRACRGLLAVATLMMIPPALTGCGVGGEDVSPRSIAKAKERWERAGIHDYDLEWTSTGARGGHYRVTVRGDEVREVRSVQPDGREVVAKPGDKSYYGVDGLFLVIEEEMAQLLEDRPFGQPKGAKVLLKFVPDERLGYPKHYRRDVVGGSRGLAIDVLRLDPKAASSSADVGG